MAGVGSKLFLCEIALGFSWALGCGDPSYTDRPADAGSMTALPDAGAVVVPSDVVDARVVEDAAMVAPDTGDTGAAPTIDPRGSYGVLARFYGVDATSQLGWFSEEITALAEVVDDGNGALSLRWQPCRAETAVFGPFKVEGSLLVPELAPARVYELQVNGGRFRTQGPPALLGYEPLEPSSCAAGTRQPKPDRGWLRDGSCSCPSANDAPPTSTSDCRVIDSDRDSHPGATVRYTSGSDSYMAIRDRSQLLEGVLDASGWHKASYQRLADVSTLVCTAGPCTAASSTLCPTNKNPVRFQPLAPLTPEGEAWTCAALSAYVVSHPFDLDAPSKPDC